MIAIVTISRKDCQVTIQLSSIERVFPVGGLPPTGIIPQQYCTTIPRPASMNKLWTNYEQNMNKQMFGKIKLKSDYS